MTNPTVRSLDVAGVSALLDLAAAEGWNPGVGDARAFHGADPDGFLERRVDGSFAAGISVVRQDTRHGFLGLYIATPELRGRGHGLALWDEALARLAERGVTSVGLDGVVERQADYRRSGFAYRHPTFRYLGRAAGLPDVGSGVEPAPLRPDDIGAALALDRAIGGVDRSGFLVRWWAAPVGSDRTTLAVHRNGALAGVGTVRRCPGPHKIGPLLVAEPGEAGARVAATLLRALADVAGATSLTVDVPGPNAVAISLLEGAGFVPTFETARMYLGAAPAIDTARLWGVATLELG